MAGTLIDCRALFFTSAGEGTMKSRLGVIVFVVLFVAAIVLLLADKGAM
jgi:hypothetical protein